MNKKYATIGVPRKEANMRENGTPSDIELVQRILLIQQDPEAYYRDHPRFRFGFQPTSSQSDDRNNDCD
ncbi:hypothetical protein [Corynebacterium tuberculostearicum]|uniref:hypothetical protein n=1 Tax=Corynebacterium tuberculostearicum TaxID=38304 RepID=UPI0038CF91EE